MFGRYRTPNTDQPEEPMIGALVAAVLSLVLTFGIVHLWNRMFR